LNFPRVKYVDTNTIEEQLDHVRSEINEIEREQTIDAQFAEALDLLHSTETLVRIYLDKGMNYEQGRARVIAKNIARGYYNEVSKHGES